jgi:hypothetical protein
MAAMTSMASRKGRPYFWGGPRHASVIRLTILGIWIVILAGTPYAAFSTLPKDFAQPYGVGRALISTGLQNIIFTHAVLLSLKGLALVGCIVLFVGVRFSRGLTPVLFVVVLILDSVTKSVGGFANHAQIGALFGLGLLALYSAEPFLTPFELARREQSVPRPRLKDFVWLSALIVVIPYTLIAFNRLKGGVEIFRGDALLYYIGTMSNSFESIGIWKFMPRLIGVVKLGFFVTTLFEFSSVCVFLFRPYRLVWLAVMSMFHVLTLVFMNIFFWENLVLIWALFWWGWEFPKYMEEETPA